MQITIKLKDVLQQRGMTQKELAALTGLRQASISEMSRGKRTSINKEHLSIIATKLGITNIQELIDFK